MDVQKLQAPVVTMTFQDRATVFVKQARGAMVRHIVKERAMVPADCKSFTGDGSVHRLEQPVCFPGMQTIVLLRNWLQRLML